MTEEIINKNQWAREMFSDECQKLIGIKPLEDDRLVLNAAVDFGAYIDTFKRLDPTVIWHQKMIRTMVRSKVDALAKRITQQYGTHKGYIDRVRERSGLCQQTDRRDRGAETKKIGNSYITFRKVDDKQA